MQRETYELMHDQVRAIYRALTGSDLPKIESPSTLPIGVEPDELVTQRFALLESWARVLPPIAERVPPFAFVPPVDVIEWDKEVLVELAVPGVAPADVRVEVFGQQLVITGNRSGTRVANGRTYRLAEIARGPFRRTVLLSQRPPGEPRIDGEDGIVRIHFAKPPVAQA
jgi:HSP20 family protein